MPNKNGRNRDIIVKLVSQMKKEEIIYNRKNLKGIGVVVNEDLTRQNFHVYMYVKKKMPDEVENVWTYNGTIKYRIKMNQLCTVQ